MLEAITTTIQMVQLQQTVDAGQSPLRVGGAECPLTFVRQGKEGLVELAIGEDDHALLQLQRHVPFRAPEGPQNTRTTLPTRAVVTGQSDRQQAGQSPIFALFKHETGGHIDWLTFLLARFCGSAVITISLPCLGCFGGWFIEITIPLVTTSIDAFRQFGSPFRPR